MSLNKVITFLEEKIIECKFAKEVGNPVIDFAREQMFEEMPRSKDSWAELRPSYKK